MSMSRSDLIPYGDKASFYKALFAEVEALIDRSSIATLANASAAIMQHLPDVNWVGFYLFDGTELVVGPFQGRPACVRIALGRGVCGTAAQTKETIVVEDVHQFPGHIACDAASRSEIVVPMFNDGRLLGVLDVDSPSLSRFDDQDRLGLERIAKELVQRTSW